MPSILQGGGKVKEPQPMDAETPSGGDGSVRSTLVSHGDGRHSIEHEDGSQTEHDHIGHALMHMAGKHEGGVHHHAHSDGMGGKITTHSSHHGGEPEGPNEHENADSAAEDMKATMGGDDSGGDDGDSDDAGSDRSESKDYD